MQSGIALSGIVRNPGLAVAALSGALLAWRKPTPELWQAGSGATQAESARCAPVVELFNRAAGQLGNDRLEVRLAAIYVLREIGRDFPGLADPIVELPQALREWQSRHEGPEPPIDVQAIIETLRLRISVDG